MKHSELPRHCSTCGVDWPDGVHGLCRSCRAGLPCRADTTDAVAPDPPCGGSRARLSDERHDPRCPRSRYPGSPLHPCECVKIAAKVLRDDARAARTIREAQERAT
jgi:hypothetical protein